MVRPASSGVRHRFHPYMPPTLKGVSADGGHPSKRKATPPRSLTPSPQSPTVPLPQRSPTTPTYESRSSVYRDNYQHHYQRKQNRISTPPPLTSIDSHDSDADDARGHHADVGVRSSVAPQAATPPPPPSGMYAARPARSANTDMPPSMGRRMEQAGSAHSTAENSREHSDELLQFAHRFKARRLELRLTQYQVGQAMGQKNMPDFAQSTISRFEKLMLSFENAMKLRPYIEQFMKFSDQEVLDLVAKANAATASHAHGDAAVMSPGGSTALLPGYVHHMAPPRAPSTPPPPHLYTSAHSMPHPVQQHHHHSMVEHHSHHQQQQQQHSGAVAIAIPSEHDPVLSPGYPMAYYGPGEPPMRHRQHQQPPQAAYISSQISVYGHHPFTPMVDTRTPSNGIMPPLRRRKRRLVLEPEARKYLEEQFKRNPRPVPDELTALARDLHLEKEEVRVWFCNRRQKEKRLANTPKTDLDEPGQYDDGNIIVDGYAAADGMDDKIDSSPDSAYYNDTSGDREMSPGLMAASNAQREHSHINTHTHHAHRALSASDVSEEADLDA